MSVLSNISIACLALFGCLGIRSDTPAHPFSRMDSLPRFTLWAWERREDLRSLNTQKFAIAYLDQTLTIDLSVHSQPRRDLVAFSAAAIRMPVIRVEATRFAVLDNENRAEAVRAILSSAREPGIAALQIDFDATRSQRQFYRALLFDLRHQMPSNLPLSITALASWCSWDGWLHDLPIDEAVPMLFRMEPDRRRASPEAQANIDDFRIRESLCQTSVGISTTEAWPSDLAAKRIYIFPDRGWQRDSPANLIRRLP